MGTAAVSVAPMTETGSKRRIGDILLELGFASEDALTRAAAEQERTGQPLGQILVDHGVITRLELASALAEQWSDHASITPLPLPSSLPRPAPQPHDDDQYAARLQEAVAELAQRVDASTPDAGFDGRVTELAQRVEATVARTQRLEATIATLAENVDGVTSGVEEAFGLLQSSMSGLVLDLARIDATVAALRAEPAVPAPDTSRLEEGIDELRLALQQLSERPPVDEDARRRADELAAAVGGLADRAALDGLRDGLAEVERRVEETQASESITAELEAQRAKLDELRSTLTELRERPVVDPALDARLARIETELADGLAAAPWLAEVEAIAGRLEAAHAAQEGLVRSVDDLDARLEELARRAPPEIAATRLEAVESRLAALASDVDDARAAAPDLMPHLGELHGALDALGREVAALAERPPGRVEELADQLERLAADHEERGALEGKLVALEARLHEGYVTSDDLSQAFAQAREELQPAAPLPDPRIDRIVQDLDALRHDVARADQLEREREERVRLGSRLKQLESRLPASIVSPDDLSRALAQVREELRPAAPTPDPRIDGLVQDLDALRHELAGPRQPPVPDPAVAGELRALAGRIGDLVTRDELANALHAARPGLRADPPAPDARVDRIACDLELLRAEVAQVDAAPDLEQQLSTLTGRVEQLDRSLGTQAALDTRLELLEARLGGGTVDPDHLADALGRLAERMAALEVQVGAEQTTAADVERALERAHVKLAAALPTALATTELEESVTRLATSLAGLEGLPERIDSLEAAVSARQGPEASPPAEDLRAELDERVAELGRALEERLTRVQPSSPADGFDESLDNELERTRMAIERLSMHLGEHDRALAELLRSRGVAQRLEELSTRVEELAAGGPVGSPRDRDPETGETPTDLRALARRIEEFETASQEDREKMMKRLERVASSIDWRLQRLESDDQAQREGRPSA